MEPVHLDAKGEPTFVADDDVVVGPRGKPKLYPYHLPTSYPLTAPLPLPIGQRQSKSASLLGYIVAQYIDGDDEEPTRTECVDLYVEDALPKHRAYLHRQKKVTTVLFIITLLSTLLLPSSILSVATRTSHP